MTFESGFHEGELSKDKDRNRHFLLKRTGLNRALWVLSFIFGFVCLFYYFCCFRFKAKYDRCLHLCLLVPPPLGIYFCMCSFVFIESLSARINMI